jgi:hypothetical protein
MTETRVANAQLVARLLAFMGLFMLGVSLAAWLRWLPYAEGTLRTLAKVFLVTGGADLIIAFLIMTRYRR